MSKIVNLWFPCNRIFIEEAFDTLFLLFKPPPKKGKSFFEALSGKITGHAEKEQIFVPQSVVVSYESLNFPVKTFRFSVSSPVSCCLKGNTVLSSPAFQAVVCVSGSPQAAFHLPAVMKILPFRQWTQVPQSRRDVIFITASRQPAGKAGYRQTACKGRTLTVNSE
jgi:hypothetical protein